MSCPVTRDAVAAAESKGGQQGAHVSAQNQPDGDNDEIMVRRLVVLHVWL